jgi:anti-sigma factor RsiW
VLANRHIADNGQALQGLIREHLRADAWPRGLRARVEAAVGIENPRLPLPRAQLSWRVLAASIAITALVGGGAASMLVAPGQQDAVHDSIVNAHIRSLVAVKPIDVASSELQAATPWFAGRVPPPPSGR